jgi:ABC-type Na+ efflux pump permease subunit
MKKNNSFENKSLEELKATKAKYQKIVAVFTGLMSVAVIVIVYVAITTKNWAQLATLGTIGAFLPMFISIQALDKEIKRREQNN